jgi:hypothetical protein
MLGNEDPRMERDTNEILPCYVSTNLGQEVLEVGFSSVKLIVCVVLK